MPQFPVGGAEIAIFAQRTILYHYMLKKYKSDLVVEANKSVGNGFFELTLKTEQDDLVVLPGQFVEVRIPGAEGVLLRRPISVHDFDCQNGTLKLLIHIVGNGTDKLSTCTVGSKVDVVFPLGNGFDLETAGKRPLLVGGGVGVAPLLYLAKELKKKGAEPVFLLGARTADGLLKREEYENICRVDVATEDGSDGTKGFVTDHADLSEPEIVKFTSVLQCGPTPMMKAVAAKCKAANVKCYASLENMMACGFGVCLCCVNETVNGMKRVCADGPVFNVNDLKW